MSSQVPILNLQLLRCGGNGNVFLGQRSDNGERVAVKFLREGHLPHARKAFFREVRILARRLRGLVPLLGCDMNAARPWYVMPYFAGGSLTRYAGRLSEGQLQTVATELAVALTNLHAAFIEHGDVKPDNIFMAGDGHLQVADPLGNGMGCTVLFSNNHGGTPGYWAPEVAAGGPISRAGDVYSYGATMYHLLTGRRPKDGMRLDPTAEDYVNAPKIRELIAACCGATPNLRPTIQEVLRILRGEQWAAIHASRQQAEATLRGLCVVGAIVLAGALLGRNG